MTDYQPLGRPSVSVFELLPLYYMCTVCMDTITYAHRAGFARVAVNQQHPARVIQQRTTTPCTTSLYRDAEDPLGTEGAQRQHAVGTAQVPHKALLACREVIVLLRVLSDDHGTLLSLCCRRRPLSTPTGEKRARQVTDLQKRPAIGDTIILS